MPADARAPAPLIIAAPMRYSAFISYNHRDRKTAAWLHRALENYRIPRRLRGRETAFGPLGARLPPCFQDREELAASSDLAASVRDALAQSYSLIVVCTPNGAQSRWVNEEVRAFSRLGRGNRLHCLIAGGIPNASRSPSGDHDRECLPPALFEDGGSEPMAADIRPGMDGRSAALLKLIAGVTGLGYDELRQRDAQRRARRLAAVAVAAMVGFVVMAGLTVAAVVSRNEAVVQRDIARQKTLTAERTVDFVKSLFAVSDPSEARGQTITAREVLDRGARQIEHGLANEPGVKAELATTLGEVYTGLGLYRDANRLVRSTLALPGVAPATRARQLAALGDGLSLQGDYRQALYAYGRALPAARDADRADLATRILAGRGEAQSSLDDFAGADRSLQAALALDLRKAGATHPDVARDYEALGMNAVFAGRLGQARALIGRALKIRLQAQGRFHPRVSQDLSTLGSIAYYQQDAASSERFYRQALAIDRVVLGPDHPDVAMTVNALARDILERRGFTEAEPLLQKAVDITLRERSPTNDDMAFLFANLGIAKAGLGQPREAERLFQKALVAAELHKHRNRAPILVELGELACDRRDFAGGAALLDRAAPIMKADYPTDPWRSAWVDVVRAKCLVAAGQRPTARMLMSQAAPAISRRWSADTLYGARLTAIRQLVRQT